MVVLQYCSLSCRLFCYIIYTHAVDICCVSCATTPSTTCVRSSQHPAGCCTIDICIQYYSITIDTNPINPHYKLCNPLQQNSSQPSSAQPFGPTTPSRSSLRRRSMHAVLASRSACSPHSAHSEMLLRFLCSPEPSRAPMPFLAAPQTISLL